MFRCLSMFGLWFVLCSVALAGPVYVNGVPDWDQPVLVAGGPPGGPAGPWGAWCVPTATANIMGYYNDLGVAGIGDNMVFPATPAWPATGWQDDTADSAAARTDLGWYYNTNDVGIAASGMTAYRGTMLADIAKGLIGGPAPWVGYFPSRGIVGVGLRNYGAPVPNMNAFLYGQFDTTGDLQATHTTALGFTEITTEIDNNRPLLGHFNHFSLNPKQSVRNAGGVLPDYDSTTWTDPPQLPFTDPVTGDVWYPTEGLGHTVTIVGYWLSNDATNPFYNAANPAATPDAVIVHDNTDGFLVNSPLPLVLPWTGSPWAGLTELSNVPEPAGLVLLALGSLAMRRKRRA